MKEVLPREARNLDRRGARSECPRPESSRRFLQRKGM